MRKVKTAIRCVTVITVTTLLLEGPDWPSQSSKGFCKLSFFFFFELSPPGPGISEFWEDRPPVPPYPSRSADCQGPRAGLAQQPSNDTISSDLWLKEYREHDHETCHWPRQIGDTNWRYLLSAAVLWKYAQKRSLFACDLIFSPR